MRSFRRCSWFCTCAHCALTASSCATNLLYEQPDAVVPTAKRATITARRFNAAMARMIAAYQPAPPPPPPLRPPPNPPKPPPKPPPPKPPPPPMDPAPLFQPLHGPAPHRGRGRAVE